MMPALLSQDLVFRLVLAVGIILAGLLLYRAFNRLTLARARRSAHLPAQAGASPAAATLRYYPTPACAPCKTVQRPAIQRLREQVGD